MAKEAVARVRDGRAHQFLEIRSTIVLDREALLDIEPVLVGIVLSRIAALFVEPALDPSADSIQRQFGELLFETRVVGEKDARFHSQMHICADGIPELVEAPAPRNRAKGLGRRTPTDRISASSDRTSDG